MFSNRARSKDAAWFRTLGRGLRALAILALLAPVGLFGCGPESNEKGILEGPEGTTSPYADSDEAEDYDAGIDDEDEVVMPADAPMPPTVGTEPAPEVIPTPDPTPTPSETPTP